MRKHTGNSKINSGRESIKTTDNGSSRACWEARALNQELSNQLEQARTEREEQKKQHWEELSKVKTANRMSKVIATAACVAAAAAIVIAIIL